jgi:hypothetical protein
LPAPDIDGVLVDFGYTWQVQDFAFAVTLAERAVVLLGEATQSS